MANTNPGVREPRDTSHKHPAPMNPADLAHDTGAPAHPVPEGARDLRGAAYDARINGHREIQRGRGSSR